MNHSWAYNSLGACVSEMLKVLFAVSPWNAYIDSKRTDVRSRAFPEFDDYETAASRDRVIKQQHRPRIADRRAGHAKIQDCQGGFRLGN